MPDPTPSEKNQKYRFEVALSFAGDNKRDLVRRVAENLRDALGSGKVFFDEWFEAELAGPDAQIVLQSIYGSESRLVVTCVCQRYNDKPWTQEEWRAIQAFERNLRDAGSGNQRRMRFLPLRFGEGEIDGLFATALVPDVRSRTPEEIAGLVLDRLVLAGGPQIPEDKRPKGFDPSRDPKIVSENRKKLENALKLALSAFKGQPEIFIDPTLTRDRDSINGENLLSKLVENPRSTIVVAQPQFGQTCLCHHLRLEAYKNGQLWVYLDASSTKTRKVLASIQEQLASFNSANPIPDAIILDSWNEDIIDHANMLRCLDSEFPKTPILVMANYTEPTFRSGFSFSQLQREFEFLHLQPMRRGQIRELVTKYGEAKNLPSDDAVITKVVKDLAALNMHRTPLNCLTLLRVFEKDQNEEIINRTKLIKTVLFILFTDTESFTYASSKPDVDECEYVLGKFCKGLIERGELGFNHQEFRSALRGFCDEKLMSVDVDVVIDILESNSIILRVGDRMNFKHSYWIFYFAASYMLHDPVFAEYILSDRRYVNFPEIIEFYTGTDGRRSDAVDILVSDTEGLIRSVDKKIGITEDFNPYEDISWAPSDQVVESMRLAVSSKVETSNVPDEIKDGHADKDYDCSAPYDQTIRNFLHDYSVISLVQAIRASSRALRNSKYVDSGLKLRMLRSVMDGWSSIMRVAFVLAPQLAHCGRAGFDGFGLILGEGFDGSYQKRLKDILLSGPHNVVRLLKDDLSSGKIGPLANSLLTGKVSNIQKQFLARFLIQERPTGWYQAVFEYMNLLHRNSFYLWDLSSAIDAEFDLGFTTSEERQRLRSLKEVVVAKHIEGPKSGRSKAKALSPSQAINEKNRLPIDKIRAASRRDIKGKP